MTPRDYGLRRRRDRVRDAVRSALSANVYLHALRLLHYYNYTHVSQRGKLSTGEDVRLAPNVSLSYAERIRIGDRSTIGARCSLWAGATSGRIVVGADVLIAPDVFVTASNYGSSAAALLSSQPRHERDVFVGNDVWLGTRAIVLPGVTIADGCIVGAGAVVTHSLPTGSIAVGAPARVIAERS